MSRILTFVVATAVVASLGSSLLAEDEAKPFTPESGYEALTSMAGKWVNVDNPDPKQGVDFRVTAAGSAVWATLFPGSDMEMLSVFHLDGPDTLVHTHYCALQNQPMMKLVECDEPNKMRFEFVSGTNMDVEKDLHTHHTTFRILDDGRVEVEVESWNNGKPADVSKFTLRRAEEQTAGT